MNRRWRAFALGGTALLIWAIGVSVDGASVAASTRSGLSLRAAVESMADDVTLTISTIPASQGVRFEMDGQSLLTDANGTVTITGTRSVDEHTLTLVDTTMERGDERYNFVRWAGQRDQDQAFSSTLTNVTMRSTSGLTVGFDVDRLVTPRFYDQHNVPIDARQVSSATARSDADGAIVPLTPNGGTLVASRRVTYRTGASLEISNVTYVWQSVIVAGSNVVDAGRQAFTPADSAEATVQGRFHDLTLSGADALFGYPTGTEATITYPDGSTRSAVMNGDQNAVFAHLPRGTYQATVAAGPGIVAGQQIRLSKSATMVVPVISALDLVLALGSVAALAAALILIGRKNVRRRVLAPLRHNRLVKAGSL
jgi:hypothetical protein